MPSLLYLDQLIPYFYFPPSIDHSYRLTQTIFLTPRPTGIPVHTPYPTTVNTVGAGTRSPSIPTGRLSNKRQVVYQRLLTTITIGEYILWLSPKMVSFCPLPKNLVDTPTRRRFGIHIGNMRYLLNRLLSLVPVLIPRAVRGKRRPRPCLIY